MKIGIFSGTFDPVHSGHLALANDVIDETALDRLIFLPEAVPRRKETVTSLGQRTDMLRLVIGDNPKMDVFISRVDSHSVEETMNELYEKYGTENDYYLVMGADVFEYIESWNGHRQLLSKNSIVLALRTEDDGELATEIAGRLNIQPSMLVSCLKTVLLEKGDYASGTSSRSSKMAHGGLRYLEMYDFVQVLQGIRAREDLFEVAAHLVAPKRFLIPVPVEQRFFRFKLRLGLLFYDLLVRKRERRHKWLAADSPGLQATGLALSDLAGCFEYTDGLMNDSRLVLEHIIGARQEGAQCLNYAMMTSFKMRSSGGVIVGWTDMRSGKRHELRAGVVVNCTGPWVAAVGRARPGPLAERIAYSQGTHLLFNRPWRGPALFLPMRERTRCYFVWPHFAGTLVGTTERPVEQLVEDPVPFAEEVDEILERLAVDLPGSGLDRSCLHYAFAGVRTLVRRKAGDATADLSRRHSWVYAGGMLSLVGGKFTTAALTAAEGLRKVFKLSGVRQRVVPLSGRKLPGAGILADSADEFMAAAEARGIDRDVAERAVARLGSRVRLLMSNEDYWQVLPGGILRGEIELTLQMEQVETLEDLMRRRLELEYMPGHGLESLPAILEICKEHCPGMDIEAEKERYLNRLRELETIMGIG